MISHIQRSLSKLVLYLKDVSFPGIIWFLNVLPRFFGFYVLGEKIYVKFWLINVVLLFYVYGVGCFRYLTKYADSIELVIKNYVNILTMVLTINAGYWMLSKRALIKEVINMAKMNDELVSHKKDIKKKHAKLLKRIKYCMMGYLTLNLIHDVLYQSQRANPNIDYAIVTCPALPLEYIYAKILCGCTFGSVECCIFLVVSNYNQFYLFFVSHTAGMFDILSEEISDITKTEHNEDNYEVIKRRLHDLIRRHGLILMTVQKLKSLYSRSIGINFLISASGLSLVSLVPAAEYTKVVLVVTYCFMALFVYCIVGQRLRTAAERFEIAVYLSDWNKLKVKEQKLIYVMLMLAQKPVFLRAAGLVPVQLYTFATILQATYRFVTVMKF